MALRPSLDLFGSVNPGFRDFFVALGLVLIGDLPSFQNQTERRIRIFSQRVCIPPAGVFKTYSSNPADRTAILRNQAQVHPRRLINLVTTTPFYFEQPRQ